MDSFKSLSLFVLAISIHCSNCRPNIVTLPVNPHWPNEFTIEFEVLVEEYGDKWSSKGILYYDWNHKVSDTNVI